MSELWALLLSVLLLAGNAFFVAAEFALVASKRYRMEQAAAAGSRAAKAAIAGSRELSLMLAGAQLGITVCTLGLGALAEPALEHLIAPPLRRWGCPPGRAPPWRSWWRWWWWPSSTWWWARWRPSPGRSPIRNGRRSCWRCPSAPSPGPCGPC